MNTIPETRAATVGVRPRSSPALVERLRYPLAAYVGSRILYLALALITSLIRHWPLGQELRNWDGKWYLLTAEHGYPTTIPHVYSTLGFEPLYSLLISSLNAVLPGGDEAAGLLLSLVLGGVAVIEMTFLAERWFGPEVARRASLFLCLFPGTIVFSMVYSEALGLALIAGCLLAMEDRRWVLAGVLAALATAVAPVLLAIIPAAAVMSGRELWRYGFRDRRALRSLAAPLLAPIGIAAFGVYLWIHDGTPFASYRAQNIAWKESSSPLAVYNQAHYFIVHDLIHWQGLGGLDMNLVVGVLGAFVLIWALWTMLRMGGVSLGAVVFTLGVAVLSLTSEGTPANPRMLLCAFPVLLGLGRYSGRRQKVLLCITLALTVAMSIATFAGTGLRP